MKNETLYHNVRALCAMLGVDQTILGERVGASQGSVSRWGKKSEPYGPTLAKLAELAGCTPMQFLQKPLELPSADVRKLPVVGFVGAGAAVFVSDISPMETIGKTTEIPAELNGDLALEVRGDSLLPDAEEGWKVVYVRNRPAAGPAEILDQLCVVQIDDGRILVKRVQRNRKRGLYNLVSPNAPTIEGVNIVWASLVTAIVPR